jgi:drug/metabolite transporter (DMT)-like permease
MTSESLSTSAPAGLVSSTPAIIIGLLLTDSMHYVFARLLLPYLPPTSAAMYVLAISTLQVGLYLAATRTIRWELFRRHAGFFLTIGFLVASSTVLGYVAIAYIDPGTASLLGKTTTLFSLGLGLVWLGDRFSWVEWLGVGLAILGTFIISFQPGEFVLVGVLIILASTFLYALHAAIVKRHGQGFDMANFMLFRLGSTTACLMLFTAARIELVIPGWPAWLILLLTGTVDVTISRILYYLALRRLNLSVHAIVLTLSPIITIFISLLMFHIWPTNQQLIGGVAILVGVFIVSISQARRIKK